MYVGNRASESSRLFYFSLHVSSSTGYKEIPMCVSWVYVWEWEGSWLHVWRVKDRVSVLSPIISLFFFMLWTFYIFNIHACIISYIVLVHFLQFKMFLKFVNCVNLFFCSYVDNSELNNSFPNHRQFFPFGDQFQILINDTMCICIFFLNKYYSFIHASIHSSLLRNVLSPISKIEFLNKMNL